MPRCKKIQQQENQFVLPMETGSEANLHRLDSDARREIARLLRLLIEERVAHQMTRGSGENE